MPVFVTYPPPRCLPCRGGGAQYLVSIPGKPEAPYVHMYTDLLYEQTYSSIHDACPYVMMPCTHCNISPSSVRALSWRGGSVPGTTSREAKSTIHTYRLHEYMHTYIHTHICHTDSMEYPCVELVGQGSIYEHKHVVDTGVLLLRLPS